MLWRLKNPKFQKNLKIKRKNKKKVISLWLSDYNIFVIYLW